MNVDDLDAKMRVYEQSLDQVLLPELYLVARLDGNRFTRLTKEICNFEAPFDTHFRDMMVETVKALMNYGFRVIYGFTESDEISLLFHPDEDTFGRKCTGLFPLEAGGCPQELPQRPLLLDAPEAGQERGGGHQGARGAVSRV